MKITRKNLLETAFSKDENVASTLTIITNKDAKFLKREKRNLEDKIEDLKEQLETRLSSEVVLDKAVVETTYSAIKDAEATLQLYKDFEKDCIEG